MRWLLFFIISSCLAFGETIRGIVIDVTDGDTITVLEKTPKEKVAHKVRLDGIDAPEKGQDGYSGAKYSLKKLLWGETVTVQYTKRDKYGRILGLVLYNASFINYEMVKEGWAWHFKKYSNSYELASLEIDARKDKRGLWGSRIQFPRGNGEPEKGVVQLPKRAIRKFLTGSVRRERHTFQDAGIMAWGKGHLTSLERQIAVNCAGRFLK
ncbi:thermonuclease family protein [Akkermansia sp. JRP_AM1]|uniref:thermonuclease family protein n=1 Tax=Akkermansia sp. JRP_AM1 TaxID=3414159 RepID=UPI003BFA74FF